MQQIYAIFVEEVATIANASNLTPACVFQPITKPIISQMGKNGGNALGITTDDGPLIRMSPFCSPFHSLITPFKRSRISPPSLPPTPKSYPKLPQTKD